jgi:hypothetical protein
VSPGVVSPDRKNNGYFGSKISVWLAALGLVLALVGLLVATGESIRHPERVAPPAGAAAADKPAHDAPADDVYHPPGSRIWMTP